MKSIRFSRIRFAAVGVLTASFLGGVASVAHAEMRPEDAPIAMFEDNAGGNPFFDLWNGYIGGDDAVYFYLKSREPIMPGDITLLESATNKSCGISWQNSEEIRCE